MGGRRVTETKEEAEEEEEEEEGGEVTNNEYCNIPVTYNALYQSSLLVIKTVVTDPTVLYDSY